MLKFVEEPTEGILGFFITNNKDVIIPTIKSRCQSLVITYDSDNILDKLNITTEQFTSYKELINLYLNKIASNALINHKELILNKVSERKDLEIMFKIIFEIYISYLEKSLNKSYNEEITNIYEIKEGTKEIISKLNIITKFLQDLSYNGNMELLLDKFVIEMRENHG